MRKWRINGDGEEEGGGQRSRGDRAICTATSCHASRLRRGHESRLPLYILGACNNETTDWRSDLIRCGNCGAPKKGLFMGGWRGGVAFIVIFRDYGGQVVSRFHRR